MIIVDRLEEDIAVIEVDGKAYNIPKKLMPVEVTEGDLISIDVKILKDKTNHCRKAIEDMFDGLIDDL